MGLHGISGPAGHARACDAQGQCCDSRSGKESAFRAQVALIAALLAVLTGVLVSYLTGGNRKPQALRVLTVSNGAAAQSLLNALPVPAGLQPAEEPLRVLLAGRIAAINCAAFGRTGRQQIWFNAHSIVMVTSTGFRASSADFADVGNGTEVSVLHVGS